MGKNSYKAQLNYYDHTYGWGNAGTCAQGDGRTWGPGSARTGVMYFPGLSNLKGKIINSVKITVTNRAGGQNAQKTAHFFRSASQGGINTSLGAGHKTGNQIGTLSGWFHAYAAESLSFTPTFFSSYIAAGEDTFCIYSATASEYLVWGAVTLEVAWQEPATQPSLSVSTVEMGKSVTINTPAVNSTYRHNIWAAFGNAGVAIAERVVSSTTWTPDVNLASQISNATSGVATIYCDTFDANGTQLGTKTISISSPKNPPPASDQSTLSAPPPAIPCAAASRSPAAARQKDSLWYSLPYMQSRTAEGIITNVQTTARHRLAPSSARLIPYMSTAAVITSTPLRCLHSCPQISLLPAAISHLPRQRKPHSPCQIHPPYAPETWLPRHCLPAHTP